MKVIKITNYKPKQEFRDHWKKKGVKMLPSMSIADCIYYYYENIKPRWIRLYGGTLLIIILTGILLFT